LEKNGIDSHIVEPASIAVSRRHRRAKTDYVDGTKQSIGEDRKMCEQLYGDRR
jgi:hypothetical protein